MVRTMSCRRTRSWSASTSGLGWRATASRLRRENGCATTWTGSRQGNPFGRFGGQLAIDLPVLLDGDESDYHAYAFATVRMAGAGFELCAAHVDWLLGEAGAPASAAMAEIVDGSKLLGFKLARRRPFDPSEALGGLASAWDRAMSALDEVVR